MNRAERETVIVANLADLDKGYFTVETTEPRVMRKLARLGATLDSETRTKKGRLTHALYCVPASCWRGDLSIRRKRTLSPSQAAARAATLAKNRPTGSGSSTPNPSNPYPDTP